MPDRFDVVVAGAGPGGTATAIHLAQRGHAVLLADRATFPRDKCCSEYGSPGTVMELAALGVLDQVIADHPTALGGTAVWSPNGSRLEGRFARAGGSPGTTVGMALRRATLDASLVDAARAAGVTVREGERVESFARSSPDHLMVVLRSRTSNLEIRTRAVVGADGLRSRVARHAGLHVQGHLKRMAFVVHVTGVPGLGDTAELHVGRSGYVGVNPLDAQTANVAVVVPADAAHKAAGDATGFFWRALAQFPGVRDRVDPACVVRDVLVSGPFDARCRRSVGDGVLLVGDAADFFDPFTGEGIWAALTGGRMAADALDRALASGDPVTAKTLAPYRAMRRRRFLGKWIIERVIGHAMLWPQLFNRAVERIERRGLADTLIGVTGDFLPARQVLHPWYLVRTVA